MKNKAKLLGQMRHVLTALGPLIAAYGWTDEATWAQISGVLVMVGGFAWSWFDPAKKVGNGDYS